MEQNINKTKRTEPRETRNERIMKQVKTTIAIAALVAGVGTSALAQVKQDIITFNLTGQSQTNVSQTTGFASGDWVQVDPVSGNYGGPKYYKTFTGKVTQKTILQDIGYVLHSNAGYYSSKANLVLVQGELSGFFDVSPDLAASQADLTTRGTQANALSGSFITADADVNTSIANSGDSTFVTLANGRHFALNPDAADATTSPNSIPGAGVVSAGSAYDSYPVGHMQPWGQIYVQDPAGSGTVADPVCDNVTYFFALSVQECYDCFYMNSFVSDATFKTVKGQSGGPLCCTAPSAWQGAGKDSYYLTLSFDNTINNPFLYKDDPSYVGVPGIIPGANGKGVPGDALVPDAIAYSSTIAARIAKNLPYEARFTLNGIMTYTWKLGYINKSDALPDFLGTGTYTCNGYGFIGLFCTLLNGSATFSERAVTTACCTDDAGNGWTSRWYGPGAEYVGNDSNLGWDTVYNVDIAAGTGRYYTPANVATSLTYHENFDKSYPWGETFNSGWPTPAVVVPPSE
jgi:hypothetical protein